MSKLIFNGLTHQISLVGNDGKTQGTWAAYNNVDKHATLRHLPNGTYGVQDRTAPRRHAANANGPYGSHGIIRFNVRGHPGIGVHSGRANAHRSPGPAHPTMGCIRTTDEAMRVITTSIPADPLSTVQVINNSAPVAKSASQKNHQRRVLVHHHA